jgi:hypothetical protein
MLEAEPEDASAEFDALSENADSETRQDLAERYALTITKALDDYPRLTDPAAHLSNSPRVTQETLVESVAALYNPAQLDMLGRASVIAKELREKSGRKQDGLG